MEHLGEIKMATEKSSMWNKRFRVQFGRITFGIHLIFLIILNPLVPLHFNNLVAILMKSLYFLFSTFVEVSYLKIGKLLSTSGFIFVVMVALWNNLIGFKGNRAAVIVTALELLDRIRCPI